MYAAGRAHPHKIPSFRLLEKIAASSTGTGTGSGNQTYFSNSEVLQEILYRYRAIGMPKVGFQIFESAINLPITFLPVHLEDMIESHSLLKKYPELSVRDSVHIATMKRNHIHSVYTYDKLFSQVSGIKRIALK